ncbi:MAP3K12-binding inhibitory protein 1 [Nephila pilipes]|uniref:MAP3K12-binding inhibitory protein 1 n=1 Tax=Nephila pilipes TaxID=299642 RepID=A0A8X6N6P5_NEPPI|nr:MAP3K12-binding inhibitory protein 1 [Nephila pilipes]
MSDRPKIISALESFLKELQCIEVIKEFSLQPLEIHQDSLNMFGSVCTKFTREMDSVLISHKKTVENVALMLKKVSDIDSIQEDKNCGSNSKDNVQIQVSSEELKRRIDAFKLGKRKQKDERNVQEYCGHPYIEEHHPLWGEINTCARIDAVFIPRFGLKSHVKVSKVENICGPQTQCPSEIAKQIKIDHESDEIEQANNTLQAIQERLLNMELHLKLQSDSTVKKNIFQKMKELEDRILYLEGVSPDYFNFHGLNNKSPKKQKISEKEKVFSNWSIDDVQKRIELLNESLKPNSDVTEKPLS